MTKRTEEEAFEAVFKKLLLENVNVKLTTEENGLLEKKHIYKEFVKGESLCLKSA